MIKTYLVISFGGSELVDSTGFTCSICLSMLGSLLVSKVMVQYMFLFFGIADLQQHRRSLPKKKNETQHCIRFSAITNIKLLVVGKKIPKIDLDIEQTRGNPIIIH